MAMLSIDIKPGTLVVVLQQSALPFNRDSMCMLVGQSLGSMKLFGLFLLLLLLQSSRLAEAQQQGGITNNNLPACNGIFDFYFLLDSSGSFGVTFRDRVVPFVINVTKLYTEPDLRISIVTFATEATVHLNLTRTADRQAIQEGINRLKNHSAGGVTAFIPGLNEVVKQIESKGGDRASVVLMLTDGVIFDPTSVIKRDIGIARSLGARFFVIGIGQVDQTQLLLIADSPEQFFFGNDLTYLEEVVENIRDAICIEINDVNPGVICLGNSVPIALNGSGFTNNLSPDLVSCRFQTSNGMQLSTVPSQPVTPTIIVCPAPPFTETGPVLLQVSLDGLTFIGSHVSLEIDDCKTISSATPTEYCRGRQRNGITLTGSGFSVLLDQSQAQCRFTAASQIYYTIPSAAITETTIICPPPEDSFFGTVDLQVTTNGDFYIDDVIRIRINDCSTISSATPDQYCRGRQPSAITLTGIGLSVVDQSRAQCQFRTSSGQLFYTVPSASITDTRIVCPPPETVEYLGTLDLQIVTNGPITIDDVIQIQIDNCIAFGSLQPSEWCLADAVEEIEIRGQGFTDNLIQENATCTFETESNKQYVLHPSQEVLPNLFVCPLPAVNLAPGLLRLRINNGFRFIGGENVLTINACIEVDSLSPSKWCVFEEVEEVEITGEGFTGNVVPEEASCTFRINGDEIYVTQPSQDISPNLFACPLPDVNLTVGKLYLRIHNGFTYLGDEMEIEIDDCIKKEFIFVAWIFLALLAALLLLGVCMLWCFLPLVTGKIVGGLPPEKEEPLPERRPPPPPPPAPVPPPVKPGRRWDVVDASYYGGRGIGGMKPMRVTWGGKGATELGSKLTKAKDANLIEVIEIAGEEPDIVTPLPMPIPPPVVVTEPSKGPGCWDRLKKRVKRWYAVLSSYRPVFTNHGTLGKHVIWFPGPNIQEKLPATEVENGLSQGKESIIRHPSTSPNGMTPQPSAPSGPQRRPPPPPTESSVFSQL